jgi:quercetin dioxygenase-like cupin family protein
MSSEGQANINDLLAQVLDITNLVQYQTGTIVSRTLIKKPTGTVTIFAFDAGQELSEHTAPFDALVLVLDGEAEICISGQPMHLSAGQLIIMPADKPHAVKAVKQFKMMLVMVREKPT